MSGEKMKKDTKAQLSEAGAVWKGLRILNITYMLLTIKFCNKIKNPGIIEIPGFLELLTRFELVTSSLPRMRSTY
jgi:hypothetical protein